MDLPDRTAVNLSEAPCITVALSLADLYAGVVSADPCAEAAYRYRLLRPALRISCPQRYWEQNLDGPSSWHTLNGSRWDQTMFRSHVRSGFPAFVPKLTGIPTLPQSPWPRQWISKFGLPLLLQNPGNMEPYSELIYGVTLFWSH